MFLCLSACMCVCSFLCSSAYKCVCVHVWLCICSVHVSVHLSREERSQEVWWATQVGFSEVIIFAWLTIGCHALAPNAPSNTDIKLPTHTQTHLCTFPIRTHTLTHTTSPSLIIPSLRSQRTDCWTHTHLVSTAAWLQQKVKGESNWRVFKWPGG